MSTRVSERLDDWDSRSFTGGYHELHELADAEFSGVIRVDGAELYMTSGTVVGIQRGSIEDVEAASGTLYEAPSPALPLLAVMQAEDVDVRAQYYSEDTPMEEVDRTLSDGNFTGYIELSENVLSGDYFLVYHGGRSMAVAFVGNSSKLITEEEAFETADDEVGIYKVRQVDIEPIEIPEPSGGQADGATAGGQSGQAEAATAGAGGTQETATSEEAATPATEPDAGAEAGNRDQAAGSSSGESAPGSETGTDERDAGAADTADTSADPSAGSEPSSSAASEPSPDSESEAATGAGETERAPKPDSEPEPGATGDPDDRARQSAEGRADPARSDDARTSDPSSARRENHGRSETGTADAATGTRQESATGRADRGRPSGQSGARNDQASGRGPQGTGTVAPGGATGRGTPTGGSAGGATDLETRAIPSLDPSRTKTPRPETGPTGGSRAESAGGRRQPGPAGGSTGAGQQGTADVGPEPGQRQQETESAPGDAGGAAGAEAPAREPEAVGVPQEEFDEIKTELEEREAEVERLESELDRVTTERDDLEEQLEAARRERDELAEEVERLESQLASLEEELGAAPDAERRMTAREALDGTDIFVRYLRKDDATLEKAHDGSVRREDVTGNLRLEKHTQFDASHVAVGGKSYHEFLEARPEFQFIRWTVEELLFEVRDTGHADALKVLYDALPQVDRAELNGVIEATFTDEGQETRTQESFDVVLRDRMGNPLLVANLNDSRQGATESMMTDLITAAERVGQSSETFAGAFLVTRSFFEPDALETAEEATRSGFLSRDKRRSFVNISRKQGFHLCLVEARNQNFHLAVPEL